MDGDGLRAIRKGLGYNQAKMADILAVSRQSYIAWEKGYHKMPAAKVELVIATSENATPMRVDVKTQNKEDRAIFVQYQDMRTWPIVKSDVYPHLSPNGDKFLSSPNGLMTHQLIVDQLHRFGQVVTPGAAVLICTAYPDVPRHADAFKPTVPDLMF